MQSDYSDMEASLTEVGTRVMHIVAFELVKELPILGKQMPVLRLALPATGTADRQHRANGAQRGTRESLRRAERRSKI